MKAVDFVGLINTRMAEKGLGSKEITILKGGDNSSIEDVLYCDNCDQFHIVQSNSGWPVRLRVIKNTVKEEKKMELEELKEAVVKKLISDHNMLIEEAEETVDNSVKDNGSMWNENADPDRLAKFLDSDEDDE